MDKNHTQRELSLELFRNPPKEYRGTPFWAWNCRLDQEEMNRQIGIMKEMGMGGFHIHVRTGMDTPYLSEEYMKYVRGCLDEAEKEDMLVYLYDEDRWPSGAAGGKVTGSHPEYALKILLLTTELHEERRGMYEQESIPGYGRGGVRHENGELLAVYDIVLDDKGCLKEYRRISPDQEPRGTRWYALMEHATPDPWTNDTAYLDTLMPEAVNRFIQTTYEVYDKHFHNQFGKRIPSIFTDEPQFASKGVLDFPEEQKDIFLPWTGNLEKLYEEAYQSSLLDRLPELLWELPGHQRSVTRYRYHNLIADVFSSAYCEQLGTWCTEHGIALTGHLMGEESLFTQTNLLGDAMRSYRHFGIPGIDILCDNREYTTAKQVQSVLHQTGKHAMLSELYGVTGWDCDFRTYKLQGDWQAACGVTLRVPHLFWMSMNGEAKRDYPASIGYQSPWFRQYSMIEDHFSRLNTVMTRGVPVVPVAVIHPIESYWLHWGPRMQTDAVRNQMDDRFHELADILISGMIDFDYICEKDFPLFAPEASFPLRVGEMSYEKVIVSGCETLRSSTVHRLLDFSKAGGRIYCMGKAPVYMDVQPAPEIQELNARMIHVDFNPEAILEALEDSALLTVRRADGRRETRLIHQLRKEQEDYWILIVNKDNPGCRDVDEYGELRFSFRGIYSLTLYDTMNGEIRPLPTEYRNGNTILRQMWHMHDSLLLKLTPCSQNSAAAGRASVKPCPAQETIPACRTSSPNEQETAPCSMSDFPSDTEPDIRTGRVRISLDEPNMYLLDLAEYSVDGGEFYSEEELLRIDNLVRESLHIPIRRKEVTQPYLLKEETPEHTITLRFRITSRIETEEIRLALEDPEHAELSWNGQPVSCRTDTSPFMGIRGWYVDKSIKIIALPGLLKGQNILTITVPVGRRTNLENFYLLGNFGVRLFGTEKVITEPAAEIGFGDIVPQGLPFYTGNIRYHFQAWVQEGTTLRVPAYRGALVGVLLDGKDVGNIAFSPYELTFTDVEAGIHEVTLCLYGTRQNGFAQLHHMPGVWFYQSPNSWRSDGDLWSYEYQFKPMGILKSPELRSGYFIDGQGTRRKTIPKKTFVQDAEW